MKELECNFWVFWSHNSYGNSRWSAFLVKLGDAENSGSLVRFALSGVAIEDNLEVAAGTENRFLFAIQPQSIL